MTRIPPDAFEQYVALGPGRTYVALAKRLGVSKRNITRKATAEHWQERLAKIESTARERFDEKLTETLQAVNSRHLKTLRVIQAKALQALQAMPVGSAMDAIRALDLSIRHERLILGEPSERTEVSVEDVVRREYERWMDSGAADAAPADGTEGCADAVSP
jgi:transposase-like protein